MVLFEKNEDCTGCEACANVCSANAIKMISDKLTGFMYPSIDGTKCLNCGKCVKVCPIHDFDKKNTVIDNNVIETYSVKAKNEEIRFKSTSGGFFSVIATEALEQGYVIYGAEYSNDMIVKHAGVNNCSGISRLRQSKYVQSRIGNVYIEIKELLKKGQKVLFVGAPCQVSGLKCFLDYDYEQLITIEFICLGVNSPKAYLKWIEDLEKEYKSKIINIWFKYKKYGWRESPFCTKVDFSNGKSIVLNRNNNYYMKGYLEGNFYLRDSCTKCRFMNVNRKADITIGDYWGLPNDEDDNKGTSVVLINSPKAKKIFEVAKKSLIYKEIDFDSIVVGNPHFLVPAEKNEKSSMFFHDLDELPFKKAIKKYLIKDTVIHKVKRLCRKVVKKVI